MEEYLYVITEDLLLDDKCSKKISDIHLEQLSATRCRKWRYLPTHLGLAPIVTYDLEPLEHDRRPESEKRLDFFRGWKETRGSAATYQSLIQALLKIGCREDAEFVYELLQSPESHSSTSAGTNSATPSQASAHTASDTRENKTSTDPDTLGDIRQRLGRNQRKIQCKYASFAVSLRKAVAATDVTLSDFRHFVLGLSPYVDYYRYEKPKLLDDVKMLDHVKAEIKKSESITDIFEVITTECCSFINIDVFQSIIENYKIDTNSDKDLQYSEQLKSYLKEHKISEFCTVNPELEKFEKSKEVILKFDTEWDSSITKVLNLKSAIAEILGLRSDALRLLSIKEGCVLVTFSVQSTVADNIFARGLTAKQEADIRALSVSWLECTDYKLEESKDHLGKIHKQLCGFLHCSF